MFERVFIYSESSDGLLHWLPQRHQDPQDPVSNLTFANKGTDCVGLSGCAPPPPPHMGGQLCPAPKWFFPPSGLPTGLFFYRTACSVLYSGFPAAKIGQP